MRIICLSRCRCLAVVRCQAARAAQVARPRRRPHDKGRRKLDAKARLSGCAWAGLSHLFGMRSRRWRATFLRIICLSRCRCLAVVRCQAVRAARPRRRPHDNGWRKLDAKARLSGCAWAGLSHLFGMRPRRWRATFFENHLSVTLPIISMLLSGTAAWQVAVWSAEILSSCGVSMKPRKIQLIILTHLTNFSQSCSSQPMRQHISFPS